MYYFLLFSLLLSSPLTYSKQRLHKKTMVDGTKSSDRIVTINRSESMIAAYRILFSSATIILATNNVVKHSRRGSCQRVQRRCDETDGRLPRLQPGLVRQR